MHMGNEGYFFYDILLLTGDPWPFDYEVLLVYAKVGRNQTAVDAH